MYIVHIWPVHSRDGTLKAFLVFIRTFLISSAQMLMLLELFFKSPLSVSFLNYCALTEN